MFNKKDGQSDEVETIIGPSVQVEGDFTTGGDIIVEGVVSGSIKTEKNLKIGEKAKIFANITATNILVSGEIQGNIKAREVVELTATAKIFGDIKAKTLITAAGVALHGRCAAGEEKKSKLEKIEEKIKTKEMKEIKEAPEKMNNKKHNILSL